MLEDLINYINLIQNSAEINLEKNKKIGCNTFACGENTGFIDACDEIKSFIINNNI